MSEEKATYGNDNIVRVQKDARYFVASNVPFNDERLSWEARGVMGYLLSKPNDWETRMGDLVNRGPAGMKMIRRILAELRQAGYMMRKRIKTAHGEFRWITTLYESPELNKSSMLPLGIDGAGIDAQRSNIVSTNKQSTKKERDTADPIAEKLSSSKFPLNPNSRQFIADWRADFPDQDVVIIRAIDEAVNHGAHSMTYVDRVLISWKANGVPPTREEQKASAKSTPRKGNTNDTNPRPAQETVYSPEQLAAGAAIRAKREAQRLAREAATMPAV